MNLYPASRTSLLSEGGRTTALVPRVHSGQQLARDCCEVVQAEFIRAILIFWFNPTIFFLGYLIENKFFSRKRHQEVLITCTKQTRVQYLPISHQLFVIASVALLVFSGLLRQRGTNNRKEFRTCQGMIASHVIAS